MKVLVLRYSELSQRAPFRTSLTQPFLSEAYYSDEEDTENTGDLSDDQSVVSYHQTYTHTYTHTVTRTHTQKHTLITRTQKHTLITLLLSLITPSSCSKTSFTALTRSETARPRVDSSSSIRPRVDSSSSIPCHNSNLPQSAAITSTSTEYMLPYCHNRHHTVTPCHLITTTLGQCYSTGQATRSPSLSNTRLATSPHSLPS